MRIGIYGGTFDPVHLGHLLLAETCREEAQLDEIWFLPNARSPHKQEMSMSAAEHRVQMLLLAIGGHPSFQVRRDEVDRGGLSFTVDTLRDLQAERPDDDLFLLLGADALVDFPSWKQPQEICQLASPVVVGRPDSPDPDFSTIEAWLTDRGRKLIRDVRIEMPQVDMSSSDIRRRIESGRSIRFRTPRAVEEYILTNRLYVAST